MYQSLFAREKFKLRSDHAIRAVSQSLLGGVISNAAPVPGGFPRVYLSVDVTFQICLLVFPCRTGGESAAGRDT